MPRTYVNNASNRSLGRVGMPVGSMVVSSGSSGSGGGSGYSSSSFTSGNGFNGGASASTSSRTYVDNSYNQSVGRVGMPVGSMPISRGDHGSTSSSATLNSSSGSSTKTYVDNAYNRSAGRVGMPHGSMPISRGDHGSTSSSATLNSSSGSSTKTYVDNAYNRSAGRVGMPHGSMPISKNDNSTGRSASHSGSQNVGCSGSDTPNRAYVDNAYNRKAGRVGLPVGSAPISKTNRDAGSGKSVKENIHDQHQTPSGQDKVYKDNAINRKLGRVGLTIGTAVYNKKTGQLVEKTYADNAQNRQLGRVGKPRGCQPHKKSSGETDGLRKWIEKMTREVADYADEEHAHRSQSPLVEAQPHHYDYYDDDGYDSVEDNWARQRAECYLNRKQEEISWMQTHQTLPDTEDGLITKYAGTEIPFEDLQLYRRIGQGGFGEVYFAKWKGTVVAVKKIRGGSVSKKRMKEFETEIMRFCELDHPGVVQFIGACVERPNVCIVMEYMQMSLFDALHVNDDIALSEPERLSAIRQICDGLKYLHSEKIAHCDLKSMNVLLDYEKDKVCTAKITDFGLSMIKSNVESSSTASGELVARVGTPRYSAPEVLRGSFLSAKDMVEADVYSAGLVIYEVLFDEEPFFNFNLRQLEKEVGEKGTLPTFPDADEEVDDDIISELKRAWSFEPNDRPTSAELASFFNETEYIYK